MTLIMLTSLFIKESFILSIVYGVLQFCSAGLFYMKFTYKKVLTEYLLLVGTVCGLVSALDHLLAHSF